MTASDPVGAGAAPGDTSGHAARRAPENPLEAALDVFVYAPLGLVVTAADEVPRLAAIGRERMGGRVRTARVVGRFAVATGRQQVERRLAERRPGTASKPEPGTVPAAPVAGTPPGTSTTGPAGSSTGSIAGGGRSSGAGPASAGPASAGPAPASTGPAPARTGPAPARTGPPPAEGVAPAESSLAIHGYDSLSASQVVQRLAGLEGDELEAVRLYELAHRGRRTILTRIDQLQV